ncbi:glutamine cyclotransferase [Alloactinosynnema sp. L-07]|uniref:glutaminyl-peptide cyclotransferase n=1 Tax=Alloactinosynnema sp. L-07 TaxID=1653480 RepID=UPI00065F06DC|nr:glutaminyl-peptide cyclotransferase [Alloactinosynnema sp. L-07]CRK61311.1 glutamine cyclotransferase [Alloactinosynnema sp. L-07]
MLLRRTAAAAALACLATACSGPAQPAPTSPSSAAPAVVTELTAKVLEERPHDRAAFTQGLELVDGVLYEGTGLVGQSEIRATDPTTGAVSQRTPLSGDLFGEGITVVGDRIWQITWQDGVAIERDKATLTERRRVEYQGEGWGLCHDTKNRRLVMSDGSDVLTFRDPDTFEPTGKVTVNADTGPVTRLNELECVDGTVYANVWQTDLIMRIDGSSGTVTGRADLAGLLQPQERAGVDVLNGIASVPGTDEFLVTGKLWPKLFRIRFEGHP